MSTGSQQRLESGNIPFIQAPPELATHPLLKSLPPSTFLPAELLDILNHTYFLHLLATDPSKVIPPGKSILSMMAKPGTQTADAPAWKAQVEETIHRAFWDAAYEALSSPESGIQLSRLKLLYNDLHEALKTLLPPDHRVLLTLSSPFEPTSAPLLSTIVHLREIFVALRQRCAPIRDTYIESLLDRLSEPPSHTHTAELARLIVDNVRDILKLAEAMKDDLSQFVFGTMSEAELRTMIASDAYTRERGVIIDLWKTTPVIASLTSTWCNEIVTPYSDVEVTPNKRWIPRLMQALAAPTPIACPLPTKRMPSSDGTPTESPPQLPNVLPPPFFFSTPALERIQNFLQAIVIVAALRALLPQDSPQAQGFTSRVWALLESMIVTPYPSADDTKLAHLADELLRARGPIDKEEETRLRAAVARTLQVRDPAFALLQRRLLTTVAAHVARDLLPLADVEVPHIMRTGQDRPKQHRPGVSSGVDTARLREEVAARGWDGFKVRGFEDSAVAERVREAGVQLQREITWLENAWGEELRNVG